MNGCFRAHVTEHGSIDTGVAGIVHSAPLHHNQATQRPEPKDMTA
jgi:hypothetical protein